MKQTSEARAITPSDVDIDLLKNEKFDRHQQNRTPSLQACRDGEQEAVLSPAASIFTGRELPTVISENNNPST
jgi:hypothetical protein